VLLGWLLRRSWARRGEGTRREPGFRFAPSGLQWSRIGGRMKFGLFGSAQAKRGGADIDSGAGFRDFIEYNVEAEALGYASTFVVEHHFTGFGQVSASLNLLTFLAARTSTLRLGT